MHVTLLIVLPAFAWLTDWQLHRALSGNTLSWAYTFEWPLFAGYACYMWWQLIHDDPLKANAEGPENSPEAARGSAGPSRGAAGPTTAGAAPDYLQPGWALSGGRRKNVAIAASTTIDDETGGRGERYTPQTEEEALELARYNRYLAGLDAADDRLDAADDRSGAAADRSDAAAETRRR
jgi:hypothetical protein